MKKFDRKVTVILELETNVPLGLLKKQRAWAQPIDDTPGADNARTFRVTQVQVNVIQPKGGK